MLAVHRHCHDGGKQTSRSASAGPVIVFTVLVWARRKSWVEVVGLRSHEPSRDERLEALWRPALRGSGESTGRHTSEVLDAAAEPRKQNRAPLTPHQIDPIHDACDSGMPIARWFRISRMAVYENSRIQGETESVLEINARLQRPVASRAMRLTTNSPKLHQACHQYRLHDRVGSEYQQQPRQRSTCIHAARQSRTQTATC